MTAQEIFNRVWHHLLAQYAPSTNARDQCAYRGYQADIGQAYHGYVNGPSMAVQEWAGIAVNRLVVINGRDDTLMYHNDAGATFEQTASAIEEQL